MKKALTFVAVALIALASSFSASARIITFGPKVGLNVDNLSGKGTRALEDACGFTAGVMGEVNVPVIGVGVDLSLMFTRMSAKVDHGNDIFQNMLEIPLNVKYKFNIPMVNHIIRPYVFTGPTLALRLGGNYDDLDWRKGQWGWNAGIGLELIKHLQIGAGYTFGMNRAVDEMIGNQRFKIRNNYWTVTAAWLF